MSSVSFSSARRNGANLARTRRTSGKLCHLRSSAVSGGAFAGQNVVLTGTLTRFKRSEAQKRIEEEGGINQSAVTSKTTLVIAGESAGSKLDKAKALGIRVLDEAEFLKILGEE